MDRAAAQRLVDAHPRWHQRFEIFPGVMTPGISDVATMSRFVDLPARMEGLRVLDVGACDGYFTLQCALRGAEVTAFDYLPRHHFGFAVMEQIHGLSIAHLQDNLFNIGEHALQPFDIVLFLGVLYHLPDPLRALHQLRQLCRGTLFLETIALPEQPGERPLLEYCPGRTLNGDLSNFWMPNTAAVHAMLADFGFVVRHSERAVPNRLHVRATSDGSARGSPKAQSGYVRQRTS